jgi:hypothetical protein
MTLRASALAAILLAFVSVSAFAQKDSGTLLGTVRDATGAVVPQASVAARNVTTNVETDTVTNQDGEYVVRPLQVGEYSVTIDARGFAPSVFERVVLDVDQRLRVDVVLKIGSNEQRVTVTDVPPPLNTDDMTVGQVIQNRQIQDMPLNGRNFQQLASLVPGAIPSYGARDSGQGGVSLSGTRSFDNSFLLDGVNNTTNTAEMPTRVNVAVSPNLDAIQEFKIQSSTYDAQYGGSAAGTINIVTKSGTNELHGTLYDYWRNSDLNANSWENNRRGIARGFRNRNQFGGVVGGPVYIPRAYDGRNKTFFFADYEGVRDIMPPGLLSVTVPDQKMRVGDFSEFLPGSNTNPGGPTFVLGAPYVNNVLPLSLLDPVAKGLAVLYPSPNIPGTLQYAVDVPHTFNSANYGARLDHRISQSDSLFARYTGNGLTTRSGTWNNLIGPVNQNKTDGTVLVISETHLFRPPSLTSFASGSPTPGPTACQQRPIQTCIHSLDSRVFRQLQVCLPACSASMAFSAFRLSVSAPAITMTAVSSKITTTTSASSSANTTCMREPVCGPSAGRTMNRRPRAAIFSSSPMTTRPMRKGTPCRSALRSS